MAECPINIWEGKKGDKVNRKAVDASWIDDPNPEVTWYEFIETSMVHDLLWGNAYWLPVYTNAGDSIAQLWTLPPWQTFVSRTTPNNRGIPGDKVYHLAVNQGIDLSDKQVVHFPGIGYDGIRGLSPIAHARQTIGLGVAAEQYGARLFGSGSLMSGIVSTDQKMTPEQAETMKARWRDKVAGLQKAHEVIVMDAGLKWTPIGIPPDDAQFLQTRAFAVEEVCRLFGVPPHLVMQLDKTSSWGRGIAEQSLSFVRYTMQGWFERYAQRISKRICGTNQYAEFDITPLIQGDQVARYSSYNTAISGHWLSPNEVRGREGLPRIEPDTTPGENLDSYNWQVVTAPPVQPNGPQEN
jgi:HK97 family phage portal protein